MGQFLVKLFVAILGLGLLLGMLLFLLIYVLWAALRWLITGKKPQVAVVWQQYSTMRKNFRQRSSSAPNGNRYSTDDSVVDVEVRELKDLDQRLPPVNKR
jgi:hypothetical protein